MAQVMSASLRSACYRLFGGYALIGLVYYATFADMVGIWWNSSTFNHCFLILPIALYLANERRDELFSATPGMAPAALLFIGANSGLWFVGALIEISLFQHLAVVGLIIGTTWLLLGGHIFRILMLPLFYLYFCVPEGEFLVPYLQDLTAEVLVRMLRLSDVPVFIEGRHLAIPSGNFVVAEACSGINYLIATLSVSTMYAYLRYYSWPRRALFMLIAVAVPLIANGLRAYGIVMIADKSDYKYAMGVDHFVYGWVFFGIVIFILFALGNLFAEDMSGRRPPVPVPASPQRGPARAALVTALLLVIAPGTVLGALEAARQPAPPIAAPGIAGWQSETISSGLSSSYRGHDQHFSLRYTPVGNAEYFIDVQVFYFATQGPGRELISQLNRVFDQDKFKQLSYGRAGTGLVGPLASVNEYVLREGLQDYVIWQWFDVDGSVATTRLEAKFLDALGKLRPQAAGSAAIIVMTALDDARDGRALLREFLRTQRFDLTALATEEAR